MSNFFVLSKKLGELCVEKRVRIAFAESCTGGMLSSAVTDIAGSSAWFNGSAVVYSNLAKTNILGVDVAIIEQHGAVSEATALVMAKGALLTFHADMSLSITGVAGPGGGSMEKPVGMVCFGLCDKKTMHAETRYFTGGRHHIRCNAVSFALEWMIESFK